MTEEARKAGKTSVAADGGGPADEKGGESRRAALRRVAAGLGLVAGGSLLPERWSRPVVDFVIGPASATVSDTTTATTVP